MISGRVVCRLLVSAWLLWVQCQSAAQVGEISKGELALTPEFCQDVQTINGWSQYSNPSPRSPHWVGLMGQVFFNMHHYCWALIRLNRLPFKQMTPKERDFEIHVAIQDFNYVVDKATQSGSKFVLLPEIHYRIGDAYVLRGDHISALVEFQKSRSIKPDYWPPYVGEAKLMMKAGKKKEALELLEQGLTLMPNQPNLLAAAKDINDAGPKRPLPARK